VQLFVIRRRNGWTTGDKLEEAAAVSARIGDQDMPNDIRWIRSYVVEEPDGSLGTICIYEASSPEAIRDHANRVGMPADEIAPVLDTVIVRQDPAKATA